jgi:hypothetical protein
VYLGWTGFFTIFALGALLWLEAILATAFRSGVVDLKLETDVASFALVWTMLGLVEIAAFILLFVVQ